MKLGGNLSKREHQIMDLAYEKGEIGSGELESLLPGRPSNSAIRVHLRTLEAKGFMTHREENGKFYYCPTRARNEVARVEFSRLIQTFFGGSVTAGGATLLDQDRGSLSDEDLEEMQRLIEKAIKEGR